MSMATLMPGRVRWLQMVSTTRWIPNSSQFQTIFGNDKVEKVL